MHSVPILKVRFKCYIISAYIQDVAKDVKFYRSVSSNIPPFNDKGRRKTCRALIIALVIYAKAL